jgi:hypothetical protein
MMKIIAPIVVALSALWITEMTTAAAKENCNKPIKCFYIDNEELLPTAELSTFASYASLSRRFNSGGERVFVFSPRYKQWGAYDRDGYRVSGGIANGGSDYCSDLGRRCHTPVGVFRVRSKGSPGCVSNKFPLGRGGSPMPYCMFFRGGYAIHGSPYISNRNGSHGCIRVHTHAARWLHRYFMRPGTKVIVLPY